MSGVVTGIATAASAVVILTGLAITVRVLLRVRDTLRDNIRATQANTNVLDQLQIAMNGRITRLEEQVAELKGKRRR